MRFNRSSRGKGLEDEVGRIFRNMGYSVEVRKNVTTEIGAPAEFDLLIYRHSRITAVECKNYDDSRPIGAKDIRDFAQKIREMKKIRDGIFISMSSFTTGARTVAAENNIDLWDSSRYYDNHCNWILKRGRLQEKTPDPILPIKMTLAQATDLAWMQNWQTIMLRRAALICRPYYQVKYQLTARRRDASGRIHTLRDEDTYFVDALDGRIVNLGSNVVQEIGRFLKKDLRIQSKERKMIVEDLRNITPVLGYALPDSGCKLVVPDPEVSERDALDLVRSHVVGSNTKEVEYKIKIRGEMETRSFTIVPRMTEVKVHEYKLIRVPKWDLTYEVGERLLSRRFLASSARVIEDDLAKCEICPILMKRASMAVCEVCGRPLCERHSHLEDIWLCPDHISETLRQDLKRKTLFARVKSRIIQQSSETNADRPEDQ